MTPITKTDVARIWSIARLTKRAAQQINLSIAQHLPNCAIFDQSRSALVIGLRSGLGLVIELGSNAQRVLSNAQIDHMRLTLTLTA